MSKNKCPVPEQCSSLHKSGNTSYSDATPSTIPSSLESSFFEKNFMDSLVSFMEQCHFVLENWKQLSGKKEFTMTEEERQAKMRELISLIAKKEQEISQLEAERAALDTNLDASQSGYDTSGGGFSPPQPMGPQYFPQTMPPSAQQPGYYDMLNANCLEACYADCSSSADATYGTNNSSGSGYGAPAPIYPPPRPISTPVKRSTRPPVFTGSQYDSSGCDSECPNAQDSTLNKYYRKLRMHPS